MTQSCATTTILPLSEVQSASLSKDAQKRLLWIDWYFSHGKNAERTCRHFGLSKSVFYRWFNRYDKQSLQALEFDTKTRRPKRVGLMITPQAVVDQVVAIRKQDPEKSKYEIQEELRREGITLGYNTVQKIINRHPELLNIQHRRRMRKHRHYQIARVKAAVELREQDLGSLVQIDTKYLYVLGRKFYLFTAIECKSRYAFLYCYKTISSASGKDFLRRVREYFPFPIHAVNTDNGSEYLLEFHQELESWSIPHYFTNPHCPKQNGRVERLHQTAEYEYFDWQDVLPELEDVRNHCMLFNTWYNTQRFHQSLGYQTPMEVVQKSMQQKGGQPFSI